MIRTAILIDERDRRLGACTVPDSATVIEHDGAIFVRAPQAIRLAGGGIGVCFVEQEPIKRERLSPV